MKSNIFLTLIIVLTGSIGLTAQQTEIKFSTEGEIRENMELVPCKGREERRQAVKSLFQKMGAGESEIVFEKPGDVENVVVTKKGKTDEIVIVGAHFDKADMGCGAMDNWSGIVILANLYRTLKVLTTQKTYQFVAFDKEEWGLLGSNAMAKKIPRKKREKYCAMVNYDSFGITFPQAQSKISTQSLIELANEVSDEMKIPFGKAGINFASSDSESFRKREIPAISFHGLDNNWKDYLHTVNDQLNSVNSRSVYIGYRHGLVFLSKIDNKPCDEFRK